jgi:hypothetical protein
MRGYISSTRFATNGRKLASKNKEGTWEQLEAEWNE